MGCGVIRGVTDTREFKHCPYCGESYDHPYEDGTAYCRECDKRFGVVEVEDE